MKIFIIDRDDMEGELFIQAILLNAYKIIRGYKGHYAIDNYLTDIDNVDEVLERPEYGEKHHCDIWFPRNCTYCYELWKSTPDVDDLRLKIELN